MSERYLYRAGAVFILVGTLGALVFNLMHPRNFDFDNLTGSVLETIPKTSSWSLIHIGLVAAVFLSLVGLYAFQRSIGGAAGAALARLASVALMIGGIVFLAALALDGVGGKVVADALVVAKTGTGKLLARSSADAVFAVSAALNAVGILTFFGGGFSLISLAVLRGEGYPKWLGWMGLVGGLASGYAGGALFYHGSFTQQTITTLTVASILITLVGLAFGVLLWRKGESTPG